jgi:hypothetical protein
MNKQILLNVSYEDTTDKFYSESYIKNKIFTLKPKQNLHTMIKDVIYDNDYVELLYKGKPKQNMYVDTKDGETIHIGYIYRGKTEIDNKRALFNVWVDINEVIPYKLKDLDN